MLNFDFLGPADAELWPLTDRQGRLYSLTPATKHKYTLETLIR